VCAVFLCVCVCVGVCVCGCVCVDEISVVMFGGNCVAHGERRD